jgi:hypothetical protein
MSSNAVGAVAVIFVSGFAGCAATARADVHDAPAAQHMPSTQRAAAIVAAKPSPKLAAPVYVARRDGAGRAALR